MAHRPHKYDPAPYSVRTKHNAGRLFKQIYVPSRVDAQGNQHYAWIELIDPPKDAEVLDLLYDPKHLADWKVAYLHGAYVDFRAVKNARDRGDISYSDWVVEVHDGPQYTTVSLLEDQVDSEMSVASWLSHLSEKQARHIRLHVLDGYGFVEIARLEYPDADDAEIETKANSIGRSAERGLKKLAEILGSACPDQ